MMVDALVAASVFDAAKKKVMNALEDVAALQSEFTDPKLDAARDLLGKAVYCIQEARERQVGGLA